MEGQSVCLLVSIHNVLKNIGILVTRWKGKEMDSVSVARSHTPFSLS